MTLHPLRVLPGPFNWRGAVPSSKSVAIRHLVIGAYAEPEDAYRVELDTEADDVRYAREALQRLEVGDAADCGEGGAVLRFLALRASRLAGHHRLIGGERLFQRPIAPLIGVLEELGATASVDGQALVVESTGVWSLDAPITVDASVSSQFASAVLLNAWKLDRALVLELDHSAVSEPYRAMTLAVLRATGMEIEERPGPSGVTLAVPPGQTVRPGTYAVESDASSALALAAAGAVTGTATIERFPHAGLQPDACFPDLLEKMGAQVTREADTLTVSRGATLQAAEVNLGNAPDLVCVLAVCCGLAEGRSRLRGAPHLRHKESDRIARTAELLRALGRTVQEHEDGIEVVGRPADFNDTAPFVFDARSDHRLAMAAGVAALAGARIELKNPHVVSKSFPQFWEAIGVSF